MNIPDELKYTSDHEWIKLEDGIATIGISDFAQGELGDVVYVELPETGDTFEKGASFGSIEAVKAVADLFCPISGEVVEINETLEDEPQVINEDPYGKGWMIKIKAADVSEFDDLLDADAYNEVIS